MSVGVRGNTTPKHPGVDEARLRDQSRGVELAQKLVPVGESRGKTKTLHGEEGVHGSGEATASEEETDEGAEECGIKMALRRWDWGTGLIGSCGKR